MDDGDDTQLSAGLNHKPTMRGRMMMYQRNQPYRRLTANLMVMRDAQLLANQQRFVLNYRAVLNAIPEAYDSGFESNGEEN